MTSVGIKNQGENLNTRWKIDLYSLTFIKILKETLLQIGLARLIEISVNRSIYNRKTVIDMKIQKLVTFNGCPICLFN